MLKRITVLLAAIGVHGHLSAQQKQDVATAVSQTVPGAAATVGTKVFGLPLSEWVAAATFVFIVLQVAHLIWKWRRQAKTGQPDTEMGQL